MKFTAALNRLPDLQRRVRELESEIERLKTYFSNRQFVHHLRSNREAASAVSMGRCSGGSPAAAPREFAHLEFHVLPVNISRRRSLKKLDEDFSGTYDHGALSHNLLRPEHASARSAACLIAITTAPS